MRSNVLTITSFVFLLITISLSSCKNKIVVPTVTTDEVSGITYKSANCGGTVVSDGEDQLVARGICWSSKQNPTINDFTTSEAIHKGPYFSTMSDLKSYSTYYVRAYASNSVGVGYGQEKTFTTSPK